MTSRSRSNSMEASPLLIAALTPTKSKQLDKIHFNVDAAPSFRDEAIALIQFAFPIITTLVLEFLPGAFSVAIVGHIDSPLRKEFVDAATLSTMFLNITGLSIGFGLSTAMDTLCSQTVGAGKLYNLGMYFQSGLIVLGYVLMHHITPRHHFHRLVL
ncbi:Aste57867_2103 [Aphanomyces stellatus]|uniref:Aste57867_2103 protein n=1 Tax=Aphanomyces stellatus TaxID=120398 RepID=A0A485K6P8_9STRA|nr:hypothetical protein As57867_002098 [Aphanomyces stellatus]VFT79306.1 Aste57867_2103 [Aphanomyces stellatus]